MIAFLVCLGIGALCIAIGWNARITYDEWQDMRDEESAPVTDEIERKAHQ